MTREELERAAEKYATREFDTGNLVDPAKYFAHLAGATSREPEIRALTKERDTSREAFEVSKEQMVLALRGKADALAQLTAKDEPIAELQLELTKTIAEWNRQAAFWTSDHLKYQEEIRQLRTQLTEERARVAKAREALEHYSIIADVDGALGRDRREVARKCLAQLGDTGGTNG